MVGITAGQKIVVSQEVEKKKSPTHPVATDAQRSPLISFVKIPRYEWVEPTQVLLQSCDKVSKVDSPPVYECETMGYVHVENRSLHDRGVDLIE